MIAPHFPPCKAVAAKRALCFANNLPTFGWEPAVIALSEEIQKDPNLVELVPKVAQYRYYRGGPIAWIEDCLFPKKERAVSVTKASTSQNLKKNISLIQQFKGLPFDKFTKYIPTLIPGALRFLRKNNCELIYATGGPFSSFILAHILAKLTGLPLVLDLRDPYTVDPIYRGRWSPLGFALASKLEAKQFQRASKVILNTRSSYQTYCKAYRGKIDEDKFTFIRNHFDPKLYETEPSQTAPAHTSPDQTSSKDSFKIIFYGHLTPIRNASLFLKAMRLMIDQKDLKPGQVSFATLGRRTQEDESQIVQLHLEPFVEKVEWCTFTKSRIFLQQYDLLLDLTSAKHYMRISGKLYDYLSAKRPILCLSENEEMKEILSDTRAGKVVPNQVDLIAQALVEFYEAKIKQIPSVMNDEAIYQYSAEPAAQKLANIFDQAVGAIHMS